MKKYVILLVVIFLLVYAGGKYITSNMVENVTLSISEGGKERLQMEVLVDNVHVQLYDGVITIGGIYIENSKAYNKKHLMRAHDVIIKLNVFSLMRDVTEIESIVIKDPIIVDYEVLSLTRNNIDDALKNLVVSANNAEDIKIKIKSIDIEGGILRVERMTDVGENIVMSPVKMKDIEETTGGLIAIIVEEILSDAKKEIEDSDLVDLKSIAERNMQNIVEGVRSRVQETPIFDGGVSNEN